MKLSKRTENSITNYINSDIADIIFDELAFDDEIRQMGYNYDDCFTQEDLKEFKHCIIMIINRAKQRIRETNERQ
jgi:hypothetical protein